MDFSLTEERQMLQDSLRRYLRDRYDTATRNAIIDSDAGMSADVWSQLAELGVIGALFSEEDGGFGGAGFDLSVVFEELGRAGVVEPFLDTAVLGGGLIAALGDASQKALLDGVIAGETLLAFAHGEPTSRYDLNRVQTSAKGNVLNGRKSVVLNAEAADYIIVSARDTGAVDDEDGISLFVVAKGAKGLTLQGTGLLSGGHAAEVMLDDVEATPLGAKGQAFPAIEKAVARANVAICAEALGAMEAATALTRDYLGTRKQFGRPLATFQALAHRLADMLIELEQCRSAVINAAGHLDSPRLIREKNVSAAKNLIGRAGRLIAEEAIQMHGGIAMTREYELAHIAKRIVMIDHRLGDVDYHLERFIALSAA